MDVFLNAATRIGEKFHSGYALIRFGGVVDERPALGLECFPHQVHADLRVVEPDSLRTATTTSFMASNAAISWSPEPKASRTFACSAFYRVS